MIPAGGVLCAVGMISAAWMDLRRREVYDFLWWIALVGAGMIYAGMGGGGREPARLYYLAIYFLLQEAVMVRCYGRADSHGFCVSALILGVCGLPMRGIVLHFAISYLFLFLVQLLRKNVGSGGKLKEPVAFVPYLVVAWPVAALLVM